MTLAVGDVSNIVSAIPAKGDQHALAPQPEALLAARPRATSRWSRRTSVLVIVAVSLALWWMAAQLLSWLLILSWLLG
jgi:hypothetical protein